MNILDRKKFKYTPAVKTDLHKTFRRVRRELAAQAPAPTEAERAERSARAEAAVARAAAVRLPAALEVVS